MARIVDGKVVLTADDSAVVDVLLDVEAANAAREAGLATERDDEIVVEGPRGRAPVGHVQRVHRARAGRPAIGKLR